MSKNSHGRRSKADRSFDDDLGRPTRNVRRAYRRPHGEDWQHRLDEEEVEELEELDALADIEDSELDALEESIEPDDEDYS